MAYDKVIDSAQLEAAITASANAIREKTGDTALIQWLAEKGFAEAIAAIEAGGGVRIYSGTYTPQSDTTAGTITDVLAGNTPNDWPEIIVMYALRTETQENTSHLEARFVMKTGASGNSVTYKTYEYGYNKGIQKRYMPYVSVEQSRVITNSSLNLNPGGSGMRFQTGVEYKWIAIGGNFA